MRISDCSSDVCSSDLGYIGDVYRFGCLGGILDRAVPHVALFLQHAHLDLHQLGELAELLVVEVRKLLLLGQFLQILLDRGRALDEFGDQRRHRLDHRDHYRSEEHTSELQSLMRISYAVFCLKQKKTITKKQTNEQ